MAHAKIEAFIKIGTNRRMNPDGRYGLQCVDLADLYAQELFNVPWPQSMGGVQGARQLLDVSPDKYWTRINNDVNQPNLIPQRGDLIVWNGNGNNQWGHVALVLSATTTSVTVLQQDGFAAPVIFVDGNYYSNKPAHIATLGYNNAGTGPVSGWLRPKLAAAPAPKPVSPAPALASYQRKVGAKAVAYRKSHAQNATHMPGLEWLQPGKTYDFKGFVRGEEVGGNNVWFVGKHTGGYSWSGGFTDKSTKGLVDLTPAPKPEPLLAPNERTTGKSVVNLRKGAGTQHDLLKLPTVPDGQLNPDTTYVFKGYVTNGMKVGGSTVWLVSKSGGYAHLHGFTNQKLTGLTDLTPKATTPAPKPVQPAPTTPAPVPTPEPAGYSFKKDVACVTEVVPARVGHFAADGIPKKPLKIVIHQFDAGAKRVGADSVISWFTSPENNNLSSAHFVVHGKRIVQMVALKDRAYHGGAGGNDYIGIETYVDENGNDADTFASVVKLILELEAKYGYRFDLIDHRSVASTSCGADIDIPAYKAAVSPKPTTPPVSDSELEAFQKFITEQMELYVSQRGGK